MSLAKIARLLGTICVVFIVVVLAYSAVFYFNHRGLVKVVVKPIPSDSLVTIDGKDIKAGTIYLKPGVYTFSASRQYFDSIMYKVNTTYIPKSHVVYLLPLPNSVAAKQWLNQHPLEQQEREAVGGLNSETTQSRLTRKYPIINKLPVYNSHYRIDYSISQGDNITFSITLYAIINQPSQYAQYQAQLSQYKTEALQFLSSNGIDPSLYQIKYTPNVQ
jgi:hypothetical protein